MRDILHQYSFILGGYLAESLASLLRMPVAFPLPLHQSCGSQKCSRGSKSPLFENHWTVSMPSSAFQSPCVLANGSTRKLKWADRRVSPGDYSPNYLLPAKLVPSGWFSKITAPARRPLHTALAFSPIGSFSLAHLPTTPCPENFPLLI